MADVAAWIRSSAEELTQLIAGEGRDDESKLQHWLERHPAFVPGFAGRGMSGWRPWPSALITQPRLLGFQEKVPDFCWLSLDSAQLTAMFVEIEVPAKPWMRKDRAVTAPLSQARAQIDSWRAWFLEGTNSVSFLDDYLVPDSLRRRQFRQHYILVYGSRAEYAGSESRTRQRGAAMAAADEDWMSFDRLTEIGRADAAGYGCVVRRGEGYEVVAIPPTWQPKVLSEDAFRVTSGYEEALVAAGLGDVERKRLLGEYETQRPSEIAAYRYRPPRR